MALDLQSIAIHLLLAPQGLAFSNFRVCICKLSCKLLAVAENLLLQADTLLPGLLLFSLAHHAGGHFLWLMYR